MINLRGTKFYLLVTILWSSLLCRDSVAKDLFNLVHDTPIIALTPEQVANTNVSEREDFVRRMAEALCGGAILVYWNAAPILKSEELIDPWEETHITAGPLLFGRYFEIGKDGTSLDPINYQQAQELHRSSKERTRLKFGYQWSPYYAFNELWCKAPHNATGSRDTHSAPIVDCVEEPRASSPVIDSFMANWDALLKAIAAEHSNEPVRDVPEKVSTPTQVEEEGPVSPPKPVPQRKRVSIREDLNQVREIPGRKKIVPPKRRVYREPSNTVLTGQLGFPNLYNTCYANGALKFLSAYPDILNHLTALPTWGSRQPIQEAELRSSLYRLLSKLHDRKQRIFEDGQAQPADRVSYKRELEDVFQKFKALFPRFKINEQSDAGEFVDRILDALHSDRAYPSFEIETQKRNDRQVVIGTSRQQQTNPRFELPVGTSNIADYFRDFAKPTEVQNQFYNPRTKEFADEDDFRRKKLNPSDWVRVFEKNQIKVVGGKVPQMIKIRLNRDRQGNRPPVEISDTIEIPFEHENGQRGSVWMQPSAVIVGGHLRGGHYYTYLYDDAKKTWFKHDDEKVSQVSTSQEIAEMKNDMERQATEILYKTVLHADEPTTGP